MPTETVRPVEVLVPPLSQTLDTVVLVEWLKATGDPVQAGEPLFVIETDKANLDVESPASGIVGELLAAAGAQVAVRSVIATILPGGKMREVSAPERDAAHAARPPGPQRTHGSPAATAGERSPEPLPLSRLDRIVASPRARGRAAELGVDLASVRPSGPEGMIVERDVLAAALLAEETSPITPLARRLAESAGLDWHAVAGKGPRGQISREDVERALAAGMKSDEKAAPPVKARGDMPAGDPGGLLESYPLAGVRAVISRRMSDGHLTTAPVTLTAEIDATALVALRGQLAADGVPVTYNDLFLYVLGRALREHPRLNASLDGETVSVWRRVDVALAVDTDRGLLAPVLRDVPGKGLREIAGETASLVGRARAGECTPDELRGSTFTLTNLGGLGIDAFTPIINLPECAILGVGRIKTRPAWVDGVVAPRELAWLSLTFDHRLVDGATAARFLARVAELAEKPHLLIA